MLASTAYLQIAHEKVHHSLSLRMRLLFAVLQAHIVTRKITSLLRERELRFSVRQDRSPKKTPQSNHENRRERKKGAFHEPIPHWLSSMWDLGLEPGPRTCGKSTRKLS